MYVCACCARVFLIFVPVLVSFYLSLSRATMMLPTADRGRPGEVRRGLDSKLAKKFVVCGMGKANVVQQGWQAAFAALLLHPLFAAIFC